MNAQRLRILSLAGLVALGLFAAGAWQIRGMAAAPQAGAKKQLYRCPMHPDVVSDQPGKCTLCGMTLVPAGAAPGTNQSSCGAGPEGGCCGGGSVPEPGM